MKQKIAWVCNECGHQQIKWSGSCIACQQWNTFEKIVEEETEKRFHAPAKPTKPKKVNEISVEDFPRFSTGFNEFDRLLGSGVVFGSLNLIGGDPGIGKSTLMLQLSNHFALLGKKVLYICGEESEKQTSLRAKRLGVVGDLLYLYSETNFANIAAQIEELKPDVLIVDSIQIVYKPDVPSCPGSVTQVRDVALECMHIAKGAGITTFIIGHVTKQGELAGPRVLEHIVDTVLEFEGDRRQGFRMMRMRKNRFGPTDDLVIFQMTESGLEEVENPSRMFLEERSQKVPGSVIIPTMEGSRAFLVEVQALVSSSAFSTSSRKSSGIDQNRLALLLAVLEKRMGYRFGNLDVFSSIVGGLKITEPAIDLGILMAISSSYSNRVLEDDIVFVGEVGLSGEIRSVPRIEQRIKEAKLIGFKRFVCPKRNVEGIDQRLTSGLEIIPVQLVEEVVSGFIG
ncbi:MAG: DNA repair protein RadA [Chlamydiae bacterium]|nr:DNA repair protein RadA [Chlamydiota bacterium]